jgi:hypothetical protein
MLSHVCMPANSTTHHDGLYHSLHRGYDGKISTMTIWDNVLTNQAATIFLEAAVTLAQHQQLIVLVVGSLTNWLVLNLTNHACEWGGWAKKGDGTILNE